MWALTDGSPLPTSLYPFAHAIRSIGPHHQQHLANEVNWVTDAASHNGMGGLRQESQTRVYLEQSLGDQLGTAVELINGS
jgi:hypothetical protein